MSQIIKTATKLLAILIITLVISIIYHARMSPPLRAQGQTKHVLAFYYAWYDPNSFGPGKTPYQPEAPYYSTDSQVIQRHVSQAQAAGINGFVQSWYGPAPQQTETNFRTLLNIASSSGFKAAVDFESGSPYFTSNNDRIAALNTLLSSHATHPAYLKVDGKPVIFFWANWILSVNDWVDIRNQVDPAHNSIWIAEGGNTEYLAVFDGLHIYNIAWSNNPAGTSITWASRTREAANTYGGYKYWVGTAMPGFNDSLLGRGDSSITRDRNNGSYYQASFSGAANSSPDMLIINSFNEWAEGSNIEPSKEFGSLYLDLTSQLSAGFRAGSLASVAVQEEPTAGPTLTPTQTPTSGPSPTPTETPLPTNSPTPASSPTPLADGSIMYEVVQGDTFLGIADRFGINVSTIYELNNLTPDTVLSIGQRLLIGYGDQGTDPSPELAFPGAIIQEDGTAIYAVVEGDTPIGIANRYGLTLEELFELNDDLNENSVLRIGQRLIVGRLPIPEEIGGSTERAWTATPEPMLSPTSTSSPTPEPSVTPPLSSQQEEGSSTPTSQNENTAASSINIDSPVLILFVGLVLLLASVGFFLIYLGKRS